MPIKLISSVGGDEFNLRADTKTNTRFPLADPKMFLQVFCTLYCTSTRWLSHYVPFRKNSDSCDRLNFQKNSSYFPIMLQNCCKKVHFLAVFIIQVPLICSRTRGIWKGWVGRIKRMWNFPSCLAKLQVSLSSNHCSVGARGCSLVTSRWVGMTPSPGKRCHSHKNLGFLVLTIQFSLSIAKISILNHLFAHVHPTFPCILGPTA